jgi:hypothetical protein
MNDEKFKNLAIFWGPTRIYCRTCRFQTFLLEIWHLWSIFFTQVIFRSWILFGHQLAKIGPKSQNPLAHVIVFIFPYISTHIGKYLDIWECVAMWDWSISCPLCWVMCQVSLLGRAWQHVQNTGNGKTIPLH